jgi:hypothetical protein
MSRKPKIAPAPATPAFEIVDCDQGSPEWFAARMGIPTASEFATVMASGRGGGESKTRATYMRKLAGEIITGEPMENYANAHMERGNVMEDEARRDYAFTRNVEPQRVGFIRKGRTGCSPDSLIGDDGVLEIKTTLPHLLIERMEIGGFPPEHRAQCQGILWVTGRAWVDIKVYWPKMPDFVVRAERDDAYIAEIAEAVERFDYELRKLVERIRAYR